jgi:hypothetical protein
MYNHCCAVRFLGMHVRADEHANPMHDMRPVLPEVEVLTPHAAIRYTHVSVHGFLFLQIVRVRMDLYLPRHRALAIGSAALHRLFHGHCPGLRLWLACIESMQ